MEVVIEHNWMVAGPGGYYGFLQSQSGSGWLDANTGVALGPFGLNIPLPIFAIAAIASLPIIIAALFFYARSTSRHHAASCDDSEGKR
jgi:hypothetical protein